MPNFIWQTKRTTKLLHQCRPCHSSIRRQGSYPKIWMPILHNSVLHQSSHHRHLLQQIILISRGTRSVIVHLVAKLAINRRSVQSTGIRDKSRIRTKVPVQLACLKDPQVVVLETWPPREEHHRTKDNKLRQTSRVMTCSLITDP